MTGETAVGRLTDLEVDLSDSFYFQAQIAQVGKKFFAAAKEKAAQLSAFLLNSFSSSIAQLETLRLPFAAAASGVKAKMDKVGIMAGALAHAIRLYYKYGGENNVVASRRKRWRMARAQRAHNLGTVPL